MKRGRQTDSEMLRENYAFMAYQLLEKLEIDSGCRIRKSSDLVKIFKEVSVSGL